LIAVTILELKPNSQDTSAFYLENIYQLQFLANANVSQQSNPVTPLKPPPFSPPKYIIWVNTLWFLSLIISLTCAMLATSMQQWARRYLRITQNPRYSPGDGARIRAFFARGVEKLGFSRVIEIMTTLIHLSLFLFFAGVLIYLFNINPTIFRAVVWSVAVSVATYMLITLMPSLQLDSPYSAPLSSLAFWFSARILGPALIALEPVALLFSFRAGTFVLNLGSKLSKRSREGIEKTAEEIVQELSVEHDGLVMKWTFDSLLEDRELDQFFEDIHSIFSSTNQDILSIFKSSFINQNMFKDPARSLTELCSWKFSGALMSWLGGALFPKQLSRPEKIIQ
jgi:Family of unknown function (DUF6535)